MSQIIIRPIVTEKMTAQGEKENRFGFVVAKTSNKVQIKNAVEKEYNVTVTGVRTMICRGKSRTRYTKNLILKGSTQSFKKAIVSVKEGETIDLYTSI
ncbi:MAG: 50S ribosomal protein L23 [Flavobacteriales bacterium]|jgi:large subunit ribosomal protein L23